jgi:transposase
MAQFAKGKFKAKTAQLERALTGRLTPTQRFLLKKLLQQYDHLQGAIDNAQAEIQRQLNDCQDQFLEEAVNLLQTIPGVGELVAETIVSEIGTEISCSGPQKLDT